MSITTIDLNSSTKRNNHLLLCITLIYSLMVVLFFPSEILSYSNTTTHPGITLQALEIERNAISKYLSVFGLELGIETGLTFDSEVDYGDGIPPEFLDKWLYTECGKLGTVQMMQEAGLKPEHTQSFLNWVRIGSIIEDAPIIRASHHFHDIAMLRRRGARLCALRRRVDE